MTVANELAVYDGLARPVRRRHRGRRLPDPLASVQGLMPQAEVPPGLTIPRRVQRRPVAGGLPYSQPLPIIEDQRHVAAWVWFAIGGGTVGVVIVAASWAVLCLWIDRLFGKTG